MRRMLSVLRRAVEDYRMIGAGDRVAVGLSGGKDSVAMMTVLWELHKFYDLKFDLVAVSLDLGAPGFDFSGVARYCGELGIPLEVVKTDIYEVIFDIRKEKNPCSLCAKMRRGALHDTAKRLGCNKVALGHHFDDVIETFFLSLFYEGRISCFSPVTYLDRVGLTLIRPFLYVRESEIRAFVEGRGVPVAFNPCPADGNTKRQEVKELVARLSEGIPELKEHVFGALCRAGIDGWHPPTVSRRTPVRRDER